MGIYLKYSSKLAHDQVVVVDILLKERLTIKEHDHEISDLAIVIASNKIFPENILVELVSLS